MTARIDRLSRISLRLAQVGGLAVLIAPMAHRFGWIGLVQAFSLLILGVLVIITACVIALSVTVFYHRIPTGKRQRWVTLFIALVVLVIPVSSVVGALGAPAIHDITTDTEAPPQFDAIVPLRGTTSNSLEYGGVELANTQREAYPDIRSLIATQPPQDSFELVMNVVRDLGWEIISSDYQAGRIEAIDTTFWFGFKDDVVVRIKSQADGSRIDVRSVSRVGVGDLGKNAFRIREFLRRLRAILN